MARRRLPGARGRRRAASATRGVREGRRDPAVWALRVPGRFRPPPHAYLGDAPPLDLEHLEDELVDFDDLANIRHPPKLRQQESADRLEALALDIHAQTFADFIDVHLAAERKDAIAFVGHRLALDVVLVADLADDFLEQILERDESRRAAVFIHDDGHLQLPTLHLLEQ